METIDVEIYNNNEHIQQENYALLKNFHAFIEKLEYVYIKKLKIEESNKDFPK